MLCTNQTNQVVTPQLQKELNIYLCSHHRLHFKLRHSLLVKTKTVMKNYFVIFGCCAYLHFFGKKIRKFTDKAYLNEVML